MRSLQAAGCRFSLGVFLAGMLLFSLDSSRSSGQPAKEEGAKPAAKGELPPLNEAAVEEAVTRGVEFLKATQSAEGTWTDGAGHEVGCTALAGIALIESGARPSDPAIRKAADFVRTKAPALADTYQISLSIIFLDRLKDPKRDDATIQHLAARLIAGQTATGGWAYSVTGGPRGARVSDPEAQQMITALKKMTPPPVPLQVSYRERPSRLGLCIKQSEEIVVRPSQAALEAADYEKKRTVIVNALPANLKTRVVFQDPSKYENLDAAERKELLKSDAGDNSNTHFAMIGLWIARKHGVPTERTFTLVSKRFRTSQDPSAGGWGYGYPQSGSSNAMTCIGLLGLAIGNALAVDPAAGRPEQDQAILKSLTFLGKNVGMPAGHFKDRPKVKDVGGLYYLWALERIAVLYDIATLDKKDWYRWGAEILIGNQLADGSWADGGFPGEKPMLNTALAILFLKRANLTPDLSKRLIIDSSALTAKVNEPPPPPPPPPPPKKEPEPTPKIDIPIFDFTKKEETPAPPPPAPKVAVPSEPAVEKKESAPIWPWLAGGIGLVAVIGLGLVFALRKKKDKDDDEEEDDEEEEKPKKKSKVAKAKKARK